VEAIFDKQVNGNSGMLKAVTVLFMLAYPVLLELVVDREGS
jgi:hypothetical protein